MCDLCYTINIKSGKNIYAFCWKYLCWAVSKPSYIFDTHTIDDGWQQGGGYGHANQRTRGALEQGHGNARARCQGPQNAHPEGAHIAPANKSKRGESEIIEKSTVRQLAGSKRARMKCKNKN